MTNVALDHLLLWLYNVIFDKDVFYLQRLHTVDQHSVLYDIIGFLIEYST